MPGARVHRVGLVASLAGLACLLFLPFGSIAAFRIATGTNVSAVESIGPVGLAAAMLPWVACLALSLSPSRSPRLALARGLLASASIPLVVALSGLAAARLVQEAGDLARYAPGAAVWGSAFSAFALVMNSRHEVGEYSVAAFAMSAIAPLGLAYVVLTGGVHYWGMAAEYRNISDDFWTWTAQHLAYSGAAMLVAIVFGVSLGIAAYRVPKFADPILGVTSLFQTIPGLAMIGILAVPLGMLSANLPEVRRVGIGVLGWAPVVIALTLYALLAIVRNTYVGLSSVPAATVEAGRGMGMDGRQVLQKVQLPLSAPVIFSGIRTAAQQTIGNATLGVFVAAGTLGRPIFGGVSQTAEDLVLLGSISLVVIALGVDVLMRGAQMLVTPKHLRPGR